MAIRIPHFDVKQHKIYLLELGIALSVKLPDRATSAFLIVNAYWEPLEFELPRSEEGTEVPWRRWIDTFLESPQDIVPWEEAPAIAGYTYRTGPRSVIVLWRSR
jgi:isoamylase